MNYRGHFRVTRDIYQTGLYKNIIDFRLFFLILGQAMFKDGVEIGGETLRRGEWLRSYRQLQIDLEYNENRTVKRYGIATIKRAIERLKAEQYICTRETLSGTVFRIERYESWQGVEQLEEKKAERIAEHQTPKRGTKRTKELQELNINKNISSSIGAGARAQKNFYDLYYQNYGRAPTAIQTQDLISYIDEDQLPEELVCLAIEKASRVSGHFNYLTSILENWRKANIKTLSAAHETFKRKRGKQSGPKEEGEQLYYTDIGPNW